MNHTKKSRKKPVLIGNVGWGVTDPEFQDKDHVIRQLPSKDRPHMNFWEEDKTRYNMYTTGFQSTYVDNKLKVTYEDVELMSIRHKRELYMQRAADLKRGIKLKHIYEHKAVPNLGNNDSVFKKA